MKTKVIITKGFQEFSGFDPRSKQEATFKISMHDLDIISRYMPEHKMLDLHCVKQICEKPARGYIGLRTVDDRLGDKRQYVQVPDPEGLCLCGIPSFRVVPGNRKEKAPEGYTFAVFMDRHLVLSDWGWIESDGSDPQAPIGWELRFRRAVWPKA